ncbi:MAG: universal stress protein [Candidatus Sulfotelmatobacter sp.]
MPAFAQISRLSLKNILFPTDFSASSDAALPFAESLARLYGSTILIAHSIPPEPHRQVVLDRLPAQDDLPWRHIRRKLEGVTRDPSLHDIRTKVLLDRGELGDVIPAMIDEHEVDLVVLGTHGRRGISKLILGSSAEKIYRSASCPVLTVGPKVHRAKNWQLRRILCPVNTSEDPSAILQYALSLAEESQSVIILLEAIPLVPWQHRAEEQQRACSALESLIPEQARDWCVPQCVVGWEHPAEAILREAQERNVDLIVMSVHKSHVPSLSTHLPWPVASEVVSQAPCAVLTVRV